MQFDNVTYYQADRDNLPDAAFEQSLHYVESKTGGRRFARRDDIIPVEIKNILSEVAFLTPVFGKDGEVIDASVQLQGTQIVGFYGEFTGKGVREGMADEIAERIIAAIAVCIDTRRPVIAETRTLTKDDKDMTARALYIPLSENGQDIDRCFVHFRINLG